MSFSENFYGHDFNDLVHPFGKPKDHRDNRDHRRIQDLKGPLWLPITQLQATVLTIIGYLP